MKRLSEILEKINQKQKLRLDLHNLKQNNSSREFNSIAKIKGQIKQKNH